MRQGCRSIFILAISNTGDERKGSAVRCLHFRQEGCFACAVACPQSTNNRTILDSTNPGAGRTIQSAGSTPSYHPPIAHLMWRGQSSGVVSSVAETRHRRSHCRSHADAGAVVVANVDGIGRRQLYCRSHPGSGIAVAANADGPDRRRLSYHSFAGAGAARAASADGLGRRWLSYYSFARPGAVGVWTADGPDRRR